MKTDVYHVVPLLEKILKLAPGELEQLTRIRICEPWG